MQLILFGTTAQKKLTSSNLLMEIEEQSSATLTNAKLGCGHIILLYERAQLQVLHEQTYTCCSTLQCYIFIYIILETLPILVTTV